MEKSVAKTIDLPFFDERTAPFARFYASNNSPLIAFQRRLRVYGIAAKPIGAGFYALIPARRASPQRCFALAVDASPNALAAAEALLDELLVRERPRGLSVLLLVAYGGEALGVCPFLRDGVAMRASAQSGPPTLVYNPFSFRGICYDYEYHISLMETLGDALTLFAPNGQRAETAFVEWWNARSRVRIGAANRVLGAALAAMAPPSDASLLARGVDAPTLELRAAVGDGRAAAKLARAALAVYRLAESTDRTLEARHFFYLPANAERSVLRFVFLSLSLGAALIAVLPEFADLYATKLSLRASAAIAPLFPIFIGSFAFNFLFCGKAALAFVAITATISRALLDVEQLEWTLFIGKVLIGGATLAATLCHPILAIAHLFLAFVFALLNRGIGKPISAICVIAAIAFAKSALRNFGLKAFDEKLVCSPNSPFRAFIAFNVIGYFQLIVLYFFS